MNDDQLHQLLRESPAPVSLPPSFNREVWSRIEAAEAPSLRAALAQAWHAWLNTLARPAPAFATIAVCILLGGSFGLVQARGAAQPPGELAYAESINPFLHNAHEAHQ